MISYFISVLDHFNFNLFFFHFFVCGLTIDYPRGATLALDRSIYRP